MTHQGIQGTRRLVVLSGLSKGAIFELNGNRVTIGRDDDCNICLADNDVSRQHVALDPHGAEFILHDLGSFNGTRLNGSLVKEAVLAGGDVLKVGLIEILYDIYPNGAAALVQPNPAQPQPDPTSNELAESKAAIRALSDQIARLHQTLAEAKTDQQQKIDQAVQQTRDTARQEIETLRGDLKTAGLKWQETSRKLVQAQSELDHARRQEPDLPQPAAVVSVPDTTRRELPKPLARPPVPHPLPIADTKPNKPSGPVRGLNRGQEPPPNLPALYRSQNHVSRRANILWVVVVGATLAALVFLVQDWYQREEAALSSPPRPPLQRD